MPEYIKKIAVIKQVRGGFSADGGQVSGLIKAETYAGFLKAEVSVLNLAPVSDGVYLSGITDGVHTHIFEGNVFDGESEIDLSQGFCYLLCFCKNGVGPVAAAACLSAAVHLPYLKEEMVKFEGKNPQDEKAFSSTPQYKSTRKAGREPKSYGGDEYDDEAISEVNYYERKTYEDDRTLFEDKAEKAGRRNGIKGGKDEENTRPVEGKKKVEKADGTNINASGNECKKDCPCNKENLGGAYQCSGARQSCGAEGAAGDLAGGDFFSRMEREIDKIFAEYPAEEELEYALEGSRFVRIPYGRGKYYVFGVLFSGGKAQYICYGVPSSDPLSPPKSLKGCSSYVPCKSCGYWLIYQDASTGVNVGLDNL